MPVSYKFNKCYEFEECIETLAGLIESAETHVHAIILADAMGRPHGPHTIIHSTPQPLRPCAVAPAVATRLPTPPLGHHRRSAISAAARPSSPLGRRRRSPRRSAADAVAARSPCCLLWLANVANRRCSCRIYCCSAGDRILRRNDYMLLECFVSEFCTVGESVERDCGRLSVIRMSCTEIMSVRDARQLITSLRVKFSRACIHSNRTPHRCNIANVE
jgi:hypothetical protein